MGIVWESNWCIERKLKILKPEFTVLSIDRTKTVGCAELDLETLLKLLTHSLKLQSSVQNTLLFRDINAYNSAIPCRSPVELGFAKDAQRLDYLREV